MGRIPSIESIPSSGIGGEVNNSGTVSGPSGGSGLLNEDATYLLLETGDYILLES